MLDFLIECQPYVLTCVHARARLEPGVSIETVHHLLERQAMLRPEVDAESIVQLGDDA